jgi:pimeloyl-ACP methyl ester carboxylesterase
MKAAIAAFLGTAALAGQPGIAQAAERHLFYVHGCCIEKVGSAAYEDIVKDLRASGFRVTFDVRRDDGDSEVKAYASKIAEQVKALLSGGAAPEDITVAGYSLGSVTAMHAASQVADPRVNYVLLAGCPGPGARRFDIDYAKVQGRVLSITDSGDDRFGSCKGKLPESALRKEIVLDSGKGHAVFRQSDDGSVRLWKEPLEAWASGR